jgi:hypothetical protein
MEPLSRPDISHMANTMANMMAKATVDVDARCHLLSLPAEIRAEIYEHLFKHSQLSIETSLMGSRCCSAPICSCAFPYQLLNTCQQLRQEAASYLWAATMLKIFGAPDTIQRLPPTHLSSIRRIVVLNAPAFSRKSLDLELFTGLKTLELHNVTVWCKYHDEAFLQTPEADECMIGLATFNLNRISSQLTQLCRDKTRRFKVLLACLFVMSSATNETMVCSSLYSCSFLRMCLLTKPPSMP